MELPENIEQYVAWGAVGIGLVTAGAGMTQKSGAATIAGIALAGLGAFLLTKEAHAEPGAAEITAFEVGRV